MLSGIVRPVPAVLLRNPTARLTGFFGKPEVSHVISSPTLCFSGAIAQERSEMGNAWSHQGLDLECPTSFFGDNLAGDLRARDTIYAPRVHDSVDSDLLS